jgi:hypothetical protein
MVSLASTNSSLSSIPSSPSSANSEHISDQSPFDVVESAEDFDTDSVVTILGVIRRSLMRQAERIQQIEGDNRRLTEALHRAELVRDKLAGEQARLTAEKEELVQRAEVAEKCAELAQSETNALKTQLAELENQLEIFQYLREGTVNSVTRNTADDKRAVSADSSDSVDCVEVATGGNKKISKNISARNKMAFDKSSGSENKQPIGRDRNEDQPGSGSRTPANSRTPTARSLLAGPQPVRRVSDVVVPVSKRRTSVVVNASSVGSGLERRIASTGGKTPPVAGQTGIGSKVGSKTRRASIAFLPSIDSRS